MFLLKSMRKLDNADMCSLFFSTTKYTHLKCNIPIIVINVQFLKITKITMDGSLVKVLPLRRFAFLFLFFFLHRSSTF